MPDLFFRPPDPLVNGEDGEENGGGGEGGESAKPGPKSMIDGCDGFECKKLCIGPADINWPQAVGSGVLKIVLHGAPNKDCLGQVRNSFETLHWCVRRSFVLSYYRSMLSHRCWKTC